MLNDYYQNDEKYIRFTHHKTRGVKDYPFHLQDNTFEIYFFISGNVNYFIEKNIYPLSYGDLFVINNSEIHKASLLSDEAYDRIVVTFDPIIVQSFNSDNVNLLDCFVNRALGEQNKIILNKIQIEEISGIFNKLEKTNKDRSDSSKLAKLICLIELLIFLNNAFTKAETNKINTTLYEKLSPILEFIDENVAGDLSLQALENKFFVNKNYLSSLFKKTTGINIHEYIVLKRISKAKAMLAEGYNITETCQLAGFNDYSHFIRSFKSHVNTSPGQYRKNIRV